MPTVNEVTQNFKNNSSPVLPDHSFSFQSTQETDSCTILPDNSQSEDVNNDLYETPGDLVLDDDLGDSNVENFYQMLEGCDSIYQ